MTTSAILGIIEVLRIPILILVPMEIIGIPLGGPEESSFNSRQHQWVEYDPTVRLI